MKSLRITSEGFKIYGVAIAARAFQSVPLLVRLDFLSFIIPAQRSNNKGKLNIVKEIMVPVMGDDQYLVLRNDAGSSLDVLWHNPDVTHVSVECEVPLSEKDFLSVFQSLAHHRKMTNLRVRCLQNALPVAALSAVINDPACQICDLTLEGLCLTGKVQEYMAFTEALRLCSLQHIRIDCCEFMDNRISLDPFVRALSSIATLESVYLSDTEIAYDNKPWDCHYFSSLVSQIRSLELNEMPDIYLQQICLLAQALENPSCALKELTIQNQCLTSEGIHRLAQMLQRNNSLETVTIDVDCVEDVIVIAKSLQDRKHPSKIQRLSFPGDWGQANQGYHSDVRKALLGMVQSNNSIEILSLGNDKSDLSIEMARYIKIKADNRLASLTLFGRSLTAKERRAECNLATTRSSSKNAAAAGGCGSASILLEMIQRDVCTETINIGPTKHG